MEAGGASTARGRRHTSEGCVEDSEDLWREHWTWSQQTRYPVLLMCRAWALGWHVLLHLSFCVTNESLPRRPQGILVQQRERWCVNMSDTKWVLNFNPTLAALFSKGSFIQTLLEEAELFHIYIIQSKYSKMSLLEARIFEQQESIINTVTCKSFCSKLCPEGGPSSWGSKQKLRSHPVPQMNPCLPFPVTSWTSPVYPAILLNLS